MKKYFFSFILLIYSVSLLFAQKGTQHIPPQMPFDSVTQQIQYREVVEVAGTQKELFERASEWLKKHYKNISEVIDSTNIETGYIECSSRVKIFGTARDGTRTMSGLVNYKLVIEVRDGRYRYTFNRFALKGSSWNPIEAWLDPSKKEWFPARFDNLREVDEQIKEIIKSLKEEMKPKTQINDTW